MGILIYLAIFQLRLPRDDLRQPPAHSAWGQPDPFGEVPPLFPAIPGRSGQTSHTATLIFSYNSIIEFNIHYYPFIVLTPFFWSFNFPKMQEFSRYD